MTCFIRGAALAIALIGTTATGIGAQEVSARPEAVGLSAVRLEKIASVVQASVDRGDIAGAVTLVARHGVVVWFDARGKQDRENGKAMRTDSIFRICSMTKPIVTLAVMMLYEEGRFQLDDPVAKYIPEFADAKVLAPQEGEPYTVPVKSGHDSKLTYSYFGPHLQLGSGVRAVLQGSKHREWPDAI